MTHTNPGVLIYNLVQAKPHGLLKCALHEYLQGVFSGSETQISHKKPFATNSTCIGFSRCFDLQKRASFQGMFHLQPSTRNRDLVYWEEAHMAIAHGQTYKPKQGIPLVFFYPPVPPHHQKPWISRSHSEPVNHSMQYEKYHLQDCMLFPLSMLQNRRWYVLG